MNLVTWSKFLPTEDDKGSANLYNVIQASN